MAVVEILLKHGAKATVKAGDGWTPLHIAAITNSQPVVKCLLAKSDVNTGDVYARTALHYACENQGHDVVQLLVQVAADVTLKDKEGKSALHVASYYCDDPRILELLITQGIVHPVISSAWECSLIC